MPRGDFDRSARRAQTRALLLQAAASVYARCGFNGATLDEVAAEAGFTKGAVYDHFGSKENLLLALMEEHLAGQVAEQIELFDRERSTWERPVAGSDRWMQRLEEDPEPFRLFVELWLYARGDERLRRGLAAGVKTLRDTLARFGATSASDAGIEPPPHATEHVADVMLALGLGLPMLRQLDPEAVPPSLLGAVLSVLIRATESMPEARELLADPDSSRAASN